VRSGILPNTGSEQPLPHHSQSHFVGGWGRFPATHEVVAQCGHAQKKVFVAQVGQAKLSASAGTIAAVPHPAQASATFRGGRCTAPAMAGPPAATCPAIDAVRSIILLLFAKSG
jgi:hypothetical protein